MPDIIIPVIDDPITISVASGPYQGEYEVKVVESNKDKLVVAMPFRNGVIVPLAGGEEVTVAYRSVNYRGQILNRFFVNQWLLSLTPPGSISLSGRPPERDGAQFIAVTSGKGGVGKSTLSVNLSIALASLGMNVCMVDVDLGTANLDLMLGIEVNANLGDLLDGRPLEEVLRPVGKGLTLLPGSSGVGAIANLNQWQMSRLVSSFNKLSNEFDIILLDTGAGVGDNVTGFLQAADQILLVTTPDPTAITDAYALLKVTSAKGGANAPWHLVVNKSEGYEADAIQAKFYRTASRHLNIWINFLGAVPESRQIASSVRQQHPYMTQGLNGKEDRAYEEIARRLIGMPAKKRGFLQKFQEAWKRIS